MSRAIRDPGTSGPERPSAEDVPFRPVTDLLMLAMVARTRRHSDHPDKGEIARQFGWRFNGAVSRRMETQLRRLATADLVTSRKRPGARRGGRHDEWTLTEAGRRHLEEHRDEVGALPESPEHRLWRACRPLAAARIAADRTEAREAAATTLVRVIGEDMDGAEVASLMALLDWRLLRLGVAVYCLRDWKEPDDDVHEEHLDPWDTPLAQFAARLELLNATAEDEAEALAPPRWEISEGIG